MQKKASQKNHRPANDQGHPREINESGEPELTDDFLDRKRGPALLGRTETQKEILIVEETTSAPTGTKEPSITNQDIKLIRERWQQGKNVSDGLVTPKPLVDNLQVAEKGVNGFFKGLAKTLVSGIIGAALFPFFGPVVATATAVTTFMVTSIQGKLEPQGLHLQDDTIKRLAEPLLGKQLFDESDLRKVIEDVLSKDKQANEDLAKAFIKLVPTIQKAAGSTNINITGPVQGLNIGDENTITQTFSGFLKER